ncbi:transmembrane protein 246-like [Anneissia japonica]|uniref:transmembrane protein 246-like n=1 Tax=Anneissia japonica TaxID=1529436 RepID=UPI0014259BB6|nr:transmembrane protein 246-like [Anneissia japonica]XP_033104967.1 transmembrane protein 246-like [Anneissia japonica]
MRQKQFKIAIFIIVFVYLLTFGIILPIMCWNLPFSRYYVRRKSTHTVDSAIKKDTFEAKKAYKYFSDMEPPESSIEFYNQAFVTRNPKYAIGIITVKRRALDTNSKPYSPQYLPRVVARFDKLLKKYNKKDVVFFLCNAQSDPEEHGTAWELAKYVPSVHKVRSPLKKRLPNSRELEKQDYVFCMNHIRKFNATYSILVQDDALPYPQFIKELDHLVTTRIENKFVRGRLQKNTDTLASVKFYFPEKWEGYGAESRLIIELIAVGAFGGGILYAIFSIFWFTDKTCSQSFIMFIMWSFYIGLLMFVIGRPYLLSLRMLSPDYYSIVSAPECCIPAVLYKTKYIELLENHLRGITCHNTYPLDVAISRFFQQLSLKQYLVVPNLFDHIGLFSSLHKEPKDPHSFMT